MPSEGAVWGAEWSTLERRVASSGPKSTRRGDVGVQRAVSAFNMQCVSGPLAIPTAVSRGSIQKGNPFYINIIRASSCLIYIISRRDLCRLQLELPAHVPPSICIGFSPVSPSRGRVAQLSLSAEDTDRTRELKLAAETEASGRGSPACARSVLGSEVDMWSTLW